MLKDIEGLSRLIIGFSKTPDKDGEDVKIVYHLKSLDLNWLRKMFNVDPNHTDVLVRQLEDQDFRLNKEQYEELKDDLPKYIVSKMTKFTNNMGSEISESIKKNMSKDIRLLFYNNKPNA